MTVYSWRFCEMALLITYDIDKSTTMNLKLVSMRLINDIVSM